MVGPAIPHRTGRDRDERKDSTSGPAAAGPARFRTSIPCGGGLGVPLTGVDRDRRIPSRKGESGPSAHRDPVIVRTVLAELAN
jgi:hypothetical protein